MNERDKLFLRHILDAIWSMPEHDLPSLKGHVDRILGGTPARVAPT